MATDTSLGHRLAAVDDPWLAVAKFARILRRTGQGRYR